MAEKLNYKQMAADIVKLVGGPSNVKSLGHCMTRLRFILNDERKADAETIKKIKGVIGVVSAGGQFMVILGQNLLPVYEAAVKDFSLNAGAVTSENLDKKKEPLTLKSAGLAALGYVSAAVNPLVTGLVAGGMLKVVLLLITLVNPDFSATSSYTILSGLADAPFFFMPIFIAYGAATKLGGTPIYAMAAAAALLHTKYTGMVAAAVPVTLLGLPVKLVSYSGSLLPALLIGLMAYYMEKLFNKIIPGIFKSLLVGLCTITVTGIAGFVVLAPLGAYLGTYMAQIFIFLGDKVGIIAVAALAACLPWLVMCGMHTALIPFMAASISDPGYDAFIRPAFILHNMAEGGACIGVGLRAKNAQLRSEALGIAFGCIAAGVSEPAIYGINLPRKKPMIGVMAGAAAGGIVMAALGAKVYVMGYSTILALPIFQDTIMAAAIAVVTAIVVAAIVTFVMNPEIASEGMDENGTETIPEIGVKVADDQIVAVVDGEMIDIAAVNDETFASKMLGDGVAFVPSEGTVVSPVNGTLSMVADTGHAFGITCEDGAQILVHIGIDTVAMNGDGFQVLAKEGDAVKAGQPVIKANLDKIAKAGFESTIMLIIADANGRNISFKEYGDVKKGNIVSIL